MLSIINHRWLFVAFLQVGMLSSVGCHTQPAAQAGPEAASANTPPIRLPDTVTPVAYSLNLQVDPNATHFTGQLTITVHVQKPTRTIWLHGKDLQVTQVAVTAGGHSPMKARYTQVTDEGMARVDLEADLPTGLAFMSFAYTGAFNTQLDGLYKVTAEGVPYAVTQFEAVAARRALVCFDEPRFKTPFEITLQVPQDLMAISNAPVIAEQTHTDAPNFKNVQFAPTLPLPTYLLAFAVGPYDVVEGPAVPPNELRTQPLPLRGIAVRGQGPRFAYALKHTGALITILERYFGVGYPFPKVDLIAVPDFAAGAMENAGAITFRDWLMLMDPATASLRQKRSFAYVTAHELAHQWFGDLVTMSWWDDLWLNEAFATWLGYRTVNTWDPSLHIDHAFIAGMYDAMHMDSLQSARQIRQPANTVGEIENAFDAITYEKGGGVLGMFESYLGAERMRAGVEHHLHKYRFSNATSEMFLQSLAEGSGESVAASFNSFLNQPGVPQVRVQVACAPGNHRLILSQSRYRPVGSKAPESGQWNIPVCWRYGLQDNKSVQRQCALLNAPKQEIMLPTCPAYLMPNADGAGYYRWVLDANDLAKLQRASLTAREQLSLADSLGAMYAAQQAPAGEVLTALAPLAASQERSVATAPMALLRRVHDEALDEASQPAAQAWIRNLYGPTQKSLGLTPKAGESTEHALLRQDVLSFLTGVGHDAALQAELSKLGAAYVGFGGDGKLHTQAAPTDLVEVALANAMDTHGAPFVQHLAELLHKQEDPSVRRQLVAAMSAARSPAVAEAVRAVVLQGAQDKFIRVNELTSLFGGQMSRPRLRQEAWVWFKANFDGLRPHLPSHTYFTLPHLAGGFCSDADAAEVESFFAPRLKDLSGADRALAQALESVRLCAAENAAQSAAARAFFSQH